MWCWRRPQATVRKSSPAPRENSFDYCTSIYEHHFNIFYITTLLFFSFSSYLTIERCESFSRIVSSATGLDKSFIFIRSTRTSSSINENSEISKRDSETKMARFALLTDQDLDVIIDEKDSKNTKSVIRVSEKILNDYLKDKDGEIKSIDELDSADVSVDTWNTILRKFYGKYVTLTVRDIPRSP